MKAVKVNGFVRISMKNAKKRYNNGETVFLCPFKLRPGGPWYPECAVSSGEYENGDSQIFLACSKEFEKVVNEFTHYNCNYSVGNYPAYYIKESEK